MSFNFANCCDLIFILRWTLDFLMVYKESSKQVNSKELVNRKEYIEFYNDLMEIFFNE